MDHAGQGEKWEWLAKAMDPGKLSTQYPLDLSKIRV